MWPIWVVAIILNVFLISWWWKLKQKYKDVEKIPGPPTKFFFGNSDEFGDTVEESFHGCQRLVKNYGPLVRVWQGPFKLILFVTNPDHVEYFLSSNVHLTKSQGYQLLQPWIREGLLTNSGAKWKKHRRILTPAFHFKILEEFTSVFDSAGQILIANLKSVEGKPVNIYEHCVRYAVDVICESSMRVRVNSNEGNSDEFLKMSKTFMNIYFRRFFSVIKRNDLLFRFFPEYTLHTKSLEYLHQFTKDIIQKRRQERLKEERRQSIADDFGLKKKKAFLDILLDTKELSEEEIQEEVDTFIFTGHDTISSALSFGLFELAKHADVQKKILDEIYDVIGTEKNQEITIKHLNEIKYLDCVVKEILRLHTTAPLIERELLEDVELDGLKIPSGTTISMNPYAQHRNENLFPNPEQFDPDRFLPHNTKNRHPFAYIPFSAGPRNCIGSKYAMMNCKATIANVVRNFEMKPVVPAHVPKLASAGILMSTNGLPIVLHSRK